MYCMMTYDNGNNGDDSDDDNNVCFTEFGYARDRAVCMYGIEIYQIGLAYVILVEVLPCNV